MKTLYMKHTEEIPLSVSEKRDLKEKLYSLLNLKLYYYAKNFY